jgi:isoaspartyl peptidase/L-asparaginase-like protein (Ntn-hydrolase superfamily)
VLTDHTGELERRQGQVLRVGTVAVEHRGDLAGATSTASGALAELGTRLGGETDLSHGFALLE